MTRFGTSRERWMSFHGLLTLEWFKGDTLSVVSSSDYAHQPLHHPWQECKCTPVLAKLKNPALTHVSRYRFPRNGTIHTGYPVDPRSPNTYVGDSSAWLPSLSVVYWPKSHSLPSREATGSGRLPFCFLHTQLRLPYRVFPPF